MKRALNVVLISLSLTERASQTLELAALSVRTVRYDHIEELDAVDLLVQSHPLPLPLPLPLSLSLLILSVCVTHYLVVCVSVNVSRILSPTPSRIVCLSIRLSACSFISLPPKLSVYLSDSSHCHSPMHTSGPTAMPDVPVGSRR